jgi:uncharacterized protein (UPF0332 family)
MTPDEFQRTAERLVRGSTEGDWRSAVSRSYYAVFHHFYEFFLSHGLDLGTGGQVHNNLYLGLYNCGLPAVRAIGQRVDALRSRRVQVDYNLRTSLSQSRAARDVHEGAAIVTDFQALLATTPAADIVDGVRNYLRSIGRIP